VAQRRAPSRSDGELIRRLVEAQPDIVLVELQQKAAEQGCGPAPCLCDASSPSSIYLPPYSPDLNPIRKAWFKLKARLRALDARAIPQLEHATAQALQTITHRTPTPGSGSSLKKIPEVNDLGAC
jgi:transposase